MTRSKLLMTSILVALSLILTLAITASTAPASTAPADAKTKTQGKAKTKGKAKTEIKAKDDHEDKWDVSSPPGDWKTITIDTTETTWSNVDVSPDGRTLIFDMLGDLYTVPLEGGEAKPLTSSIAWDFQPRFSPDGSEIAFVSDRGGANNIWVMDWSLDQGGSNPRAVTTEKEHLVHNPSWSPDGDYIVAKKDFTSSRSIAAGEIWLFHAGVGRGGSGSGGSGSGGLQLTERPNGRRDQKTMAEPAFSVDGRYVYFSQDTTSGVVWQYGKDATGQIFVIQRLDRETGRIETFAGGPGGAVRPTPSPDGKYLAFIKRTPALLSALYLKDLDSGREWPIFDHYERDLQETFGSQGVANAFSWTPDSRSIVFWTGGKFHHLDIKSGATRPIPVHVKAEKKIRPALRFAVDVAPPEVDVKLLRWVQVSPDGGTALFQALGHLYSRKLDGDKPLSEPRRLTSQNEHFENYPSFSRDGRGIVYTTWDDQDLGSVRIIPASGGPSRVLTTRPGHYLEPRFSPNGKHVAYRKTTGGYLLSGRWSTDPGLYVVSTTGGEPTRVSRSGFAPQFGADGDRLFFVDRDGDDLALKSLSLAAGIGLRDQVQTHLVASKATEISLSPDGRWVAFTEQYNAYVAPFTFSGRQVTLSPNSTSIPVRQVSKRSGEYLTWSADSSSLHWAHGPKLFRRQLRDAFAFIDGAPEELPEPVEDGTDLGFQATADAPEGLIALVGARVVTMRNARKEQEVIEDGVVVVRGNRIEAVGSRSEVEIPDGAVRIDVQGKTITPGFLDVHAHGGHASDEVAPEQNWGQYSNLAFGVTTIHDPSNDTSSIFAAAELQRVGKIVAPRIFSTGTILYGAHATGATVQLDSLKDALFHVRRMKEVGAISVKSYQQPRREQRQQIIAAGQELGMMVVPEGGGKFQNNMNMIVDGHTGIEHSLSLAHAYSDVLQLWTQTEVGYTPTMGVSFGGLEGERYWYQHTEVWKNERLMRYTPRFIVEPRAMRRTMAPEKHYNHFNVASFAKQLIDGGGSAQVGAHGQREGLASHWEMWMFHQGGFTPWEALRAGTIDGARYVGLDGDIGSIEVGKLADLVVIDGNPLEDLRRSEYVEYTMLNGRLYEASSMNQIAPDNVPRQPFFFEKEGGDTLHPAAQERIRALGQRHGWVH